MAIDDRSEIKPGTILANRYEVLSELGIGGTSRVFRVRDCTLNDEQIALKLLSPALMMQPENLERLKNEVMLARRLGHPNIIRVYDLGVAGNGQLFITMELATGQSLYDYLCTKHGMCVDLDETRAILLDLAAALEYAHDRGVVHRDIKPENVFISERGEFKLGDFGSAYQMNAVKRMTRQGCAVGTPDYMAPEQLAGNRLDGRTDIYALGILAHELATGQLPLVEETELLTIVRRARNDFPLLAELPWWFRNFVETCTELDPKDRYQSMEDVREAITNWNLTGNRNTASLSANSKSPGFTKRVTRMFQALRGN